MSTRRCRVVLLAGRGDTSRIVFNGLKEDVEFVAVIEEQPPSRRRFWQRRVRHLGLNRVLGQLAFLPVYRLLRIRAQSRIDEILAESNLTATDYPSELVTRVESVNSPEVRELVAQRSPDVIIVNGTRILSKQLLRSTPAPFVNTHTGITPAYRGVHGGYWALTQEDPENCGVTVHVVDEGVDTGPILGQARIHYSSRDDFSTYPYLQYEQALPLLRRAILECARGVPNHPPSSGTSVQWYHPTLWQYVHYRRSKGVR